MTALIFVSGLASGFLAPINSHSHYGDAMKSASSLKENGGPDSCDKMANSKTDKEFRTVTFDKLTNNLTCTCLIMGDPAKGVPAKGGKECVAGHDICLQDTGECGTAIQVWKKVPFSDPRKIVETAEQMQTVSIIVEASDPPKNHPEAEEYRYGLESAGFQEFPQIIEAETLKKFKAKLSPLKSTREALEETLWLGDGGVKKNVLKFRQQQKCFTKVGAPPKTKCAHLLPDGCKEAKGCYPNEVIDILDDLDFIFYDKDTNKSGEKYMFDYSVNILGEDADPEFQDEERHLKKVQEVFELCTVYRKNAIVQPYEKIEEDMSRPPAQYVATDIRVPSTYTRMEEKPFDSENVDAKTAVGGAFPALHIDAYTITDRHKDIWRVILDSAKHVEVHDDEDEEKIIGYAGTMHNYWIPIGSQSPGEKIDTCPLIFQTNDSPAKFKLGATTIGNAMAWATEERMHSGLMVTTKVGEGRRESVEFRRVDMMRDRPQLFDPLNCEILPKADCKLEVTEKRCEWDLQKRTCTSNQ